HAVVMADGGAVAQRYSHGSPPGRLVGGLGAGFVVGGTEEGEVRAAALRVGVAEMAKRETGHLGKVRLHVDVEARQVGPGSGQFDRVEESPWGLQQLAQTLGREVEAVAEPAFPGLPAQRLTRHQLPDQSRL